jgi:hypothetical protein
MSRKAAWVDEKLVESWMAKSFLSVRAAALSVPMGGSFSGMTHFSAAQRRFGVAYSLIGKVIVRKN